jgi:Holliday junction resolvase RusA-like endonuclease
MRDSLHIFIPGESEPQGSARGFIVGDRVIITSANKRLKAWRTKAVLTIRQAMLDAGMTEPWRVPVEVSIGDSRRSPKRCKRVYPCVRPDLDKIVRAALDALTEASVITDDCLVCKLHAWKQYDTEPGVYITVEEI